MNEVTYVIIIGILCFSCGVNTGILASIFVVKKHEKKEKKNESGLGK